MTCIYRYLYVSSGCQVSWSCFSCKQAYQYLCDRDFFFWDLWLLKLSFRKKWTKHKWRVFKLSWQLVHFTIYSDKCASYSECLWLKFSVWKYYIVLPILYHSPHAPNLFDKQQTAIFAHADSASLFDKLYNFDLPTKHRSHLWSCFRPHFSISHKKLRKEILKCSSTFKESQW